MPDQLTTTDYKNILRFYKKPIPTNNTLIKQQANKLIASKLCRCINRLDGEEGPRSIGICTKTIINSKGFTRKAQFTCKNPRQIRLIKTRRYRYR
jgi:hypothetical protein